MSSKSSPTPELKTTTDSAPASLVVPAGSWIVRTVETATLSTTTILDSSTIHHENGIWYLFPSAELVQIFTERIEPREARWLQHKELIEILWSNFLRRLAENIRALEEKNVHVWNGKGNITMTIEVVLPGRFSRQSLVLYNDTHSTKLGETKNISFRIPPVEAFSSKNLGTWESPEGSIESSNMVRERALFYYVTRPGGDIVVHNTGKHVNLPQFYVEKDSNLLIQFAGGAQKIGLNLAAPTGSLGTVTGHIGNLELNAVCYIGMVHSDEISPLKENYRWMSREAFLSIKESNERIFCDFASKKFVENGLLKWIEVNDRVFDPKRGIRV